MRLARGVALPTCAYAAGHWDVVATASEPTWPRAQTPEVAMPAALPMLVVEGARIAGNASMDAAAP